MLTVRAGLSDSAKARKGHERHATQSIKKDKTELDLNTGKKAKEKLEPGSINLKLPVCCEVQNRIE